MEDRRVFQGFQKCFRTLGDHYVRTNKNALKAIFGVVITVIFNVLKYVNVLNVIQTVIFKKCCKKYSI